MGTDKALIEIDGVPMAERVARVLEAAGCGPVVFVGGDPALAELDRRQIDDYYPGEGPVSGVITALVELRDAATAIVVTACDLSDLTVDAVRAVIGPGPDHTRLRVADSGRIEPMLACWPTGLRRRVDRAFRHGTRALHELVETQRPVAVPVDPAALRNVNEPGDL